MDASRPPSRRWTAAPDLDYTARMGNWRHSPPPSWSSLVQRGIAGRLQVVATALGFCAAIAACATPRTPEATHYKVEATFYPSGPPLPAVQPADVMIYDSAKALPVGLYSGFHSNNELVVAADFPSPDQPHRDVGNIGLHETIGYSPGEDWTHLWDEPAFAAKRVDTLKKAAAEHGANAIFLASEPYGAGRDARDWSFHAVSVSTAQPVYPSVDEVLARLHLAEDDYKEVHRFTAKMAELGTRKPEQVSFKAGHEYMFAMVLHPGFVDLGLGEDFSLVFVVNVEKDVTGHKDRERRFTERIDKQYKRNAGLFGIDGVFARGGAGSMGPPFELVSSTATIRLMLRNQKGIEPIKHLRAGEADFIVFERAVPKDKFVLGVCDHCANVARACNKRRSLEACEELRACFKEIEQPSSLCSVKYKDF
jgi:hypothetical protein